MDLVRVARAEQCAANLVALVDAHLPQAWSDEGGHENWSVAAPALIARSARTLSAIFVLRQSGHASDAAVLLRTLYEHLATFAWLAASPTPERLLAWVADEYRSRVAAFGEYNAIGAHDLYDAQAVAYFESRIDEAKKLKLNYPKLPQRVREADQHWSAALEMHSGSDRRYGFTGMYAPIFRMTSALAHPTPGGINPFVWATGTPGIVAIGPEFLDVAENVFTISPAVMLAGLLVASATLGWPDPDALAKIYLETPPDFPTE